MKRAAAILFQFIVLHLLDGREVHINRTLVTSVVDARTDGMMAEGTRCTVNLVDGRFVVVKETCAAVRSQMETAK